MSGKKETLIDPCSGDVAHVPENDKKKHETSQGGESNEEIDTYENFNFAGGEEIEPDTHTLVRSSNKSELGQFGGKRESLVGLKEGVPGIYSGYEKVERKPGKLERKGSDSSMNDRETPVRPPRRGRNKSDPVLGSDEGGYDQLWKPRKNQKVEELHAYSLLGEKQQEVFDDVKESSSDRLVILNSSPLNDDQWVEDGRRFDSPDHQARCRPMSTVVLPISPIEGSHENESENDSDWGSDFDESVPSDHDDEGELYEIIGDTSMKNTPNRSSVYDDLNAVRAKTAQVLTSPVANKPLPPVPDKPLPPIPSDSLSLHETDEEAVPYVDIIYEGNKLPMPALPPISEFATEDEIKRYQIIKYILENEKMYLTTLNNLIQDYEKPLKANRIINQESIKVIFQHLQEIEQCHKLFNIALVGRMSEWNANPTIGDIIYASFSKSMVLKAYTSYVKNFTAAMDRVKETCRTVPSFLTFLRNRLRKSLHKYSFYDLLKRPIGRFPQLVVLLQELLKVTPVCHSDRLPLQMALTHLECLSELICDKRRDMEMKYKVLQLDKYFAGLNKPLFSNRRYYIRHDDMLLCKVVDGRVVKTKHRRLFLLSDLLICASIINKSSAKSILTNKRYSVKWCVPVVEVEVLDVGSGITVNIDNKTTTTITYTHPVSSPRPGALNVEERLEDLQHDLAVIGQIAGLIASLRQSYDVINGAKVSEWYRDVKDTFDKEIETANLHWLELSIPAKDKRTTTCLFNLHPPQKKIEWTTELENAQLRLAFDNNPGWFILEDESTDVGNMGILRRNLPLLANKVPLIMVEARYAIDRVLEITHSDSCKPILWIFSGVDHSGVITLMEMSMSSVPHVIESFVACESRILAAEVVKDKPNEFADPLRQKISVWCGTMSGRIHVFNASFEEDHEEIASTRLRDSILCFKHVQGKMFAGLANGTVACFRRKADDSWDYANPVIISLSKSSVMDMTDARGRLWCAAGNCIYVLDIETLGTERKVEVCDSSRAAVKHLVSYGSGVWASVWKSPMLHLYHNETFECLQSLSVVTPLARMKNDIDTRIQAVNIDRMHVTSLLARGGLLWVGTDNGIIITYPLPRLGGVPQVSGKPCVSFHGHEGAVRCLHAFRVKRRIKHIIENVSGDDAISRSLFYIDPFDQAASSLNLPRSYPELAPPVTTESPACSNEPFYFALEPEEGGAAAASSSPRGYEEWLRSFEGNIKKVDPMFSPDAIELQNRQGGYNSDESMDSDTEFSFIEDKGKKIPAKVEKKAPSFTVDLQPAVADGVPRGTVKANNLPGGMSPISEVTFADMVSNFKGFHNEDDRVDGDEMKTSIDEGSFVMVGKTSSGYEEPIPPPDRIVTVPYSTVGRNRSSQGNGTLKEPFSTVIETRTSELVAGTDQTVNSSDPNEDVFAKYKTEPLPKLPEKTLYEKSKEWDEAQTSYENLKSTALRGSETEPPSEKSVAISGDHVVDSKGQINDIETAASSDIYDVFGDDQSGQLTKDAEKLQSADPKMEHEEAREGPSDVPETRESNDKVDNVQDPVSVSNIPSLDDQDVDEPELDFAESDSKAGTLHARDVKSPIFIKVTDLETQESIEGAMEVESGLSRDTRVMSFSGITKQSTEAQKARSETMPASGAVAREKLPWSSKAGGYREKSEPDFSAPSDPDSDALQKNAPGQLDLSAATKIEKRESIYTPLLSQTREQPGTGNLPCVGTNTFESEMALSSSLARERVTRQSQQGMYASLISVANKHDESRQELLLQPLYVVSVGSGYVDLRRKQKIGSGLDFFMKLAASEPSPKLLIWKVTS